jgi:hypothetical protein
MPIWLAVIGFFVSGCIGFVCACLCYAASEQHEPW